MASMRGLLLVGLMLLAMAVCFAFSSVAIAQTGGLGAATQPSLISGVEPFSQQRPLFRMLGGLFLCFGLLGLGVHLYKRFVIPRSLSDRRRLQVVERLQISQKSALVLVRLDGREFIMSTGSEASRIVAPVHGSSAPFSETLSQAFDEVEEFNA